MKALTVIYGSERHSVEQADNIDWLRALPDQSVDLVMTSPPYEAARTYGVDFKLKGQPFVDWCVARYVECIRVCRGLVAWVIEGQTKDYRWSATPALMMADLHRRGINLRKPPAFCRVGIPGSGGPDWLRNDYEWIICATQHGRLPWSNNKACGHEPKWNPGGTMSNRKNDGSRVNEWAEGEVFKGTITDGYKDGDAQTVPDGYVPPKLANPGNVIEQTYTFTANEVESLLAESGDTAKILVGGGVMGNKLCHENEAPFPEKLAEMFILSFCPPNGIVCDHHSGSGTTAAMAIKNGRRFIGCDVRQSQVDLTTRRLLTVDHPKLF